MFGQITALLTEIRDELRDANQMNRDWIAKLEADHLAQQQALIEAQRLEQAKGDTRRSHHKKLPAKVEEGVTNEAI